MNEERITIVKPDGAAASQGPWVLSRLDAVNLWLVLRGTWVFDAGIDAERLRDGLARILALYPHLAGRMTGGRAVALDGQGVPLEISDRPDLSVADVCDRPALAGEMSGRLRWRRVKSGQEAPMRARLTRLSDGSVLGVRCSHAFLDGRSFYTMVRNWGHAAAGRPFPPPVVDQGIVPRPAPRRRGDVRRRAMEAGWKRLSILRLLPALPAMAGGRLLDRTPPIRFTAEALDRLAAAAREASGCPDLSVTEALAAHVARLAPKLHGLDDGTPCSQVLVADARERVAEIPAGFAGNASFILPGARYPAGAYLGEIAALGHASLAPFLSRPSPALRDQILLAIETMDHGLWMSPYDPAEMHVPRPTLAYINSFGRLPVYDVDFGADGRPVRPVRVIPHDLPDPFLIWPAPPSEGGVELYLTGVAARASRLHAPGGPWWSALLSC